MQHINIIVIKNIILFQKATEKEELSEDIADITILAKVAQAISFINLALKYNM